MAVDFIKQTDKPLFEDTLWNRPISRKAAKSLVVIGGHKTQFSATQNVYQAAQAAGIGSLKVLLPEGVRKFTGNFPDAVWLPSTNSGSLALSAKDQILEYITASDGAVIAGELSRNRETISLVERLLSEAKQPLVIGSEVTHGWSYAPGALYAQTNRLLIGESKTFKQLKETLGLSKYIKPAAGLLNKLLLLEKLAEKQPASYILNESNLVIRAEGRSSVTELAAPPPEATALGVFATFWLQNPAQFETLTTAAYVLKVGVSDNENETRLKIKSFLKETGKF